ncbi:metallophosphoesterase [Paracoccus sp. M683]|uniref:metallophosphoesterase family protein n=1 Tax=Paracoccus sp. M683 TaxID=2594268 RepID=UPI001180760C|nr:metallophosphoesterase [Paracoccus sp. M683]TRW94772.1 metallophosphoesterase [Paracoccus sp. M683]
MTRILHLSDLHFGFHRAALVGPLLERVNAARVDLVVVTGDLTHRGRPEQFEAAAKFLSRITAPLMAVPGNHDVPLYNIPVRFLWPYAEYDRQISPDRAPAKVACRARVFGVNSVDPLAWQRGVVHGEDVDRITASIAVPEVNIVALHHPLQQLPQVDKELARDAPDALARFEAAGVRVALSGHLHRWAAEELLDLGHRHLLQVQAGTALCARETDLQNEFAVLDFDGDDLRIERHIAPMGQAGFGEPEVSELSYGENGWRKA